MSELGPMTIIDASPYDGEVPVKLSKLALDLIESFGGKPLVLNQPCTLGGVRIYETIFDFGDKRLIIMPTYERTPGLTTFYDLSEEDDDRGFACLIFDKFELVEKKICQSETSIIMNVQRWLNGTDS